MGVYIYEYGVRRTNLTFQTTAKVLEHLGQFSFAAIIMFGGSGGVRILWMWAFGTAGVLFAAVAKNRMKEMEGFMNRQTETSAEIAGEHIEVEFGTEDEKSTGRHDVHL